MAGGTIEHQPAPPQCDRVPGDQRHPRNFPSNRRRRAANRVGFGIGCARERAVKFRFPARADAPDDPAMAQDRQATIGLGGDVISYVASITAGWAVKASEGHKGHKEAYEKPMPPALCLL